MTQPPPAPPSPTAPTPSAPTPSAPTPPASPVGPERAATLRRPALAVTVLAAAVILLHVIELVLLALQGLVESMPYLVQGYYLILLAANLAFVASVLWLLAASSMARVDARRVSRLPLLMLGLLTLSGLLMPAGQLLSVLLQLIGVGGDDAVGYGLRNLIGTLVNTGGTVLFTLLIGVLGLLLLMRPQRAERTVRIPMGPVPLAVMLLVTALLLAVAAPMQSVISSWIALDWGLLQAIFALHAAARGLLATLLVLFMGLLFAVTAGTSRRILWAGFIAYMAAQVVSSVLVRLFMFQMLSGTAPEGEWLAPATAVVEVIGALLLATTAVVVLVLRARGSRTPRS
ncbi:hypothetical protein GCM10023160_09990 [Brachybacterium paraconglomeratum]|uniref:hypothetical protein n=1 Tax=Brachybacterium paraconglomeratum TaxID=173362 RepID=UPI0031E69C8A